MKTATAPLLVRTARNSSDEEKLRASNVRPPRPNLLRRRLLLRAPLAAFAALLFPWNASRADNSRQPHDAPRSFTVELPQQKLAIDLRRGVVTFLELESERPLWSTSGIVYKHAWSDLEDRTDLFICDPSRVVYRNKRAYVALEELDVNALILRNETRYRSYLLAIDVQREGKLAWKLDAETFRPFFPKTRDLPPNSAALHIDGLDKVDGDALYARTRIDAETKIFKIDAATGVIIP